MSENLKFAIPVTWDNSRSYEQNEIVFSGRKAYTALQDVPEETAIDNDSYWKETGSVLPEIIKEIESDIAGIETDIEDLEKTTYEKKIGNFTTITATTYADAFVCPSDGYLFVYNASNSSSYVQISDPTNDVGPAVGNVSERDAIFVKKGMKIYINGTVATVRFFPIS